jgi:uncharacterized protein YmfQ (DUF2313 family)
MARTIEDFTRLLMSLLPPSKFGFFTRSLYSDSYKYYKGVATEFVRVDQRMQDLLYEALPSYINEMLEEWENEYGLPEAGFSLANTDDGRRAEIKAKFLEVGRQDVNYYIQIAEALGYTITIEEFSPAWMHVVTMGDPVGGQENLFYWKVLIDLDYITSSSQVNISKLIYKIKRVKPAHTMVLFDFVNAGYSRGFNKGFKSIPHYDNSWDGLDFDRGFNNGFSNAYDYDGVDYVGGFNQGFSIAYDRYSGGAYNNNGFSIGFIRPN